MARTKNREYQQVLSPAYTFSRRWKMGGYIRLSKEDLKKALNGKDDSNSVKNQRDLLNDFYRKYQEEFESITEYVDYECNERSILLSDLKEDPAGV